MGLGEACARGVGRVAGCTDGYTCVGDGRWRYDAPYARMHIYRLIGWRPHTAPRSTDSGSEVRCMSGGSMAYNNKHQPRWNQSHGKDIQPTVRRMDSVSRGHASTRRRTTSHGRGGASHQPDPAEHGVRQSRHAGGRLRPVPCFSEGRPPPSAPVACHALLPQIRPQAEASQECGATGPLVRSRHRPPPGSFRFDSPAAAGCGRVGGGAHPRPSPPHRSPGPRGGGVPPSPGLPWATLCERER